jgi:hypothetical protein
LHSDIFWQYFVLLSARESNMEGCRAILDDMVLGGRQVDPDFVRKVCEIGFGPLLEWLWTCPLPWRPSRVQRLVDMALSTAGRVTPGDFLHESKVFGHLTETDLKDMEQERQSCLYRNWGRLPQFNAAFRKFCERFPPDWQQHIKEDIARDKRLWYEPPPWLRRGVSWIRVEGGE